MNRLIEEFDLQESWFTGKKITLGEQVLLEVDVRHFSPEGWSTYKFMDPDKAAEFASQWAAKGGAVVAGQDSVNNELVGARNLYYIFAGPLQSFYGTGADEVPAKTGTVEEPKAKSKASEKKKTTKECANLGLSQKPTYKDRMTSKDATRLATQGTFADFYEATTESSKEIALSGKEAFVLRAVLFDAYHGKELKALKRKFREEIDGWTDQPVTLVLTPAEYAELGKVLTSYLKDDGFMNTFFRIKDMKATFIAAAKKSGASVNSEATNEKMSKVQWEAEVTRLMKTKYGLDPQDFEITYYDNMTPEEFVTWYGEKYDLEEITQSGGK